MTPPAKPGIFTPISGPPACASRVEDIQAAVVYASENGLTVAAQSTGHLCQTLPSLERALLLKVVMQDGEIAVDPAARTARIKAGAVWGDVVDAVAL